MATSSPAPANIRCAVCRVRSELYSPGALFSWPELQAMAADGVLSQLYQRGYLLPGTAPRRSCGHARPLSPVPPRIRQRVVAGRMTAAWIYGCAAGTGPAGAAGGCHPACFQPEVHPGLHPARGQARPVRRRQPRRADGFQPAADGAGHRPARGRGAGVAGPGRKCWTGRSWTCRLRLLTLAVEATSAGSAQEGRAGDTRGPRSPGPASSPAASCAAGSRWCGTRRTRHRCAARH